MKCEVLQKTDSIDKALDILPDLPSPVCLAILEDESINGAISKIYQDIIDKASRKIAIMGKGVAVWVAADMISNGRNTIVRVKRETCSPGELHESICGLRTEIGNKPYSLVGIYVKATRSTEPSSYETHLTTITDELDCLIKITAP